MDQIHELSIKMQSPLERKILSGYCIGRMEFKGNDLLINKFPGTDEEYNQEFRRNIDEIYYSPEPLITLCEIMAHRNKLEPLTLKAAVLDLSTALNNLGVPKKMNYFIPTEHLKLNQRLEDTTSGKYWRTHGSTKKSPADRMFDLYGNIFVAKVLRGIANIFYMEKDKKQILYSICDPFGEGGTITISPKDDPCGTCKSKDILKAYYENLKNIQTLSMKRRPCLVSKSLYVLRGIIQMKRRPPK